MFPFGSWGLGHQFWMGNLRRIRPLPLPEASSEPCINVSVYLCSPNLREGMPLAGVLVHLKGKVPTPGTHPGKAQHPSCKLYWQSRLMISKQGLI